MQLTWQTIVTGGAVLAALAAAAAYLRRGFSWLERQRKQDTDIASIKAEQTLLTYGVLCCLKGLREQGCDGPVADAITRIEKHLNKAAHK